MCQVPANTIRNDANPANGRAQIQKFKNKESMLMTIFEVMKLAKDANPKAEVTIRDGGDNSILITWEWDGRFLNRRYTKGKMVGLRYGEHEAWKISFRAAAELMNQTSS